MRKSKKLSILKKAREHIWQYFGEAYRKELKRKLRQYTDVNDTDLLDILFGLVTAYMDDNPIFQVEHRGNDNEYMGMFLQGWNNKGQTLICGKLPLSHAVYELLQEIIILEDEHNKNKGEQYA